MDNSNHLGVNKMGKNIRKSLLHQLDFGNTAATAAAVLGAAKQHSQPQVFNICKSDFRNFVQRLTGSSSDDSLPQPPNNNPPKPPSMRLQKIRPPPLAPMNQPHHVHHPPAPAPAPDYYNYSFVRDGQYGQPSPAPLVPGDSPVSAYMRYLQSSMIDSGPRNQQDQGQLQYQQEQPPPLPTSPSTSQFLLPSPNFFNLTSPYSLLSPGTQYPQPLTPNFLFSSVGPGPNPPPLSPGISFPLSPSGFFSMTSPLWRNR